MRAGRIDPNNIDLDYLKAEFDRFRSELAGVKDKLGSNASEALDQMSAYLNGSNVSSRIAALEEQFEAIAGRVKGSGKQAVNRLESEVSAKPLLSIALAFGVGVLAAQLVRRG